MKKRYITPDPNFVHRRLYVPGEITDTPAPGMAYVVTPTGDTVGMDEQTWSIVSHVLAIMRRGMGIYVEAVSERVGLGHGAALTGLTVDHLRALAEAAGVEILPDALGGSIPVEDVIRLSDQEKERRAEGMREFARLLDEEYDAEFGSDHDGDGER